MASSRIFLVDDLAWWLGRVSLNPAKHIDHFGTIILPSILLLLRATFLFGSAGKRIFANTLKYSYYAKLAADNQCLEVRVLPAPPRSPIQTEISRCHANSAELAGFRAGAFSLLTIGLSVIGLFDAAVSAVSRKRRPTMAETRSNGRQLND